MREKFYTQIIEKNGHEGETWCFFVEQKENEEFLEKLLSYLKKFNDDIEYGDATYKIGNKNIPIETIMTMDKLLNPYVSGYMSLINIVKKVKEVNWEKIKTSDDLINVLYKGGCFTVK